MPAAPLRQRRSRGLIPPGLKLLVFAATPPPPHGQARMVELMLQGLRPDPAGESSAPAPGTPSAPAFEVFHVNCRLATSLEDMGRRPWAKIIPLLRYLWQARRILREHPIDAVYYCPGRPTLNNALRDWMALSGLCRATRGHSARLMLHWHAVGLESGITPWSGHPALAWGHRLLARLVHAALQRHFRAARHIALSRWHADVLKARLGVAASVIPYGIPDPAAHDPFTEKDPARPHRRLLFLSMLTRDKGFHATLAAHRELLADWLEERAPHPWRLDVAGSFIDHEGRDAWAQARQDPLLRRAEARAGQTLLVHHGFVDGAAKAALFREADVFCFPTRYVPESFGLVVLEAMAWSVPVVATAWHALPEILGPDYPMLIPADGDPPAADPRQLAERISQAAVLTLGPSLRQRFLDHYQADRFQSAVRAGLHNLVHRP